MAKLQEPASPATDKDVDRIEERLAGYRADYTKPVMWRHMEMLIARIRAEQSKSTKR